MASSSHGVASMPARVMIGSEDQGDGRDDAAEAAGVREHADGKLRPDFVTRRRPRRRLCVPRAADAAIIREADEARLARRYLAAIVRLSRAQHHRPRDRDPDHRCSASSRRWRASTPTAGSSPRAVNGVAVALRRRQPLGALAAVVVVQALAHDATYDTDPLVAVPGRADPDVHRRLRAAPAPALLGYGIGLAYVIVDFSSGRIEEIAQAGAQSGFYLLAWAAGRALRGHEERRAAAERHVVRVELEREEQARAAVVEERARIARELHDAVAHSVSVMVLQAGGVRRLLGDDPAREREREALAGVEETGRQAVHELHRMLGILRKRDPGAELAPSPSLRRVGELVDQVRAAGLEAALTIAGEPARARARAGHVRLPDRAGGADQRAALRARLDRRRDRDLRPRPASSRCATTARASTARRRRRAPATASSACASAPRSSAASWRRARRRAAASLVRARLPT